MQRMYILYVDIIQLFSICKSVNLIVLKHLKEDYWVCICWGEFQSESKCTNYINWWNKGIISICSLLFCIPSTTLYFHLPFVIHILLEFEEFVRSHSNSFLNILVNQVSLFSYWLEIKIFCRETDNFCRQKVFVSFRKELVFKFGIIM